MVDRYSNISLNLFTTYKAVHNTFVNPPWATSQSLLYWCYCPIILTFYAGCLYVPSFTFNLISASKLTTQSNFCLILNLMLALFRFWNAVRWLDLLDVDYICCNCPIFPSILFLLILLIVMLLLMLKHGIINWIVLVIPERNHYINWIL